MDGIKQIGKQDAHDVMQLWSYAFQLDWSEEHMAERAAELVPDELWGYFEKGELAAQLRIIPLSALFYGRAFKIGGVASVATWPQYRRKGFVAKLLAHALKVMKDDGQTVSLLHPFSYTFYRKYGWEINTEFKRYTIESDLLRPLADDGGTLELLSHPEEDWPLLNELYMKHAVQYNGMIYRDEAGWKHTVSDDKRRMAVVFYSAVGKLEGYLLYNLERRELHVREMVFVTEAARRKLWNFICNHESMVDKVTIVASREDQLAFLLDEPSMKQEVVPYSMARIVDVKGFLERIPFLRSASGVSGGSGVSGASGTSGTSGVSGAARELGEGEIGRSEFGRSDFGGSEIGGGEFCKFTICVKDEQAAWNNGTFEVSIDSAGKASVAKISEHSNSSSNGSQAGRDRQDAADISCDIQTLSTMMTGYQRPLDCLRYNRLTGNQHKIKLLDDALPHHHVHLLDFF